MAKRKASQKSTVVVTKNTIVISVPDLEAQIKACIRRSGKASLSIKEISVSKVPDITTLRVEPMD